MSEHQGRTLHRRRTQSERRASTQLALLDATVSSLIERGYAKTTTTEVAHRAGVSLGALVHHFPAKVDLLAAALDYVLTQRLNELDEILGALAPGEVDPRRVVDITWALFQSRAFIAWLELWMAARCEPELRPAMVDVDAKFSAGVAERWIRFFSEPTTASGAEVERSLVFAVCNGLAMRRIFPAPHEAEAEEVLSLLKNTLFQHETNRS